MVTVLGHREHTEAVLLQTRAADQWNEYQSRKLRVQELSLATDELTLGSSGASQAVQAKLTSYKAQMKKWQVELSEGSAEAQRLEQGVDVAERKAARFDMGEALLQIAVILASITLLTRHQRYAIAGVVLGIAGMVFAAAAFLVR
jgi:hypothetical protein